jgi:very-short-patch-repair endonuclease
MFPALCVSMGLPKPVAEHKFSPTRRWSLDFAWPEYKLGLEVDGAIFSHGRHSRGSGIIGDMEKFNAAAVMGWRVIKFTPQQIMTSATILTIRQCLYPLTSSTTDKSQP